MPEHVRIHPFPSDPVLEELANQLLECGAVLSQIVSGMIQWQAAGLGHPDAAPIPAVAQSLIADVLKEVKQKHSRRDLKVAAAVVEEATEAICENIFSANPDEAKDSLANGHTDDDSE